MTKNCVNTPPLNHGDLEFLIKKGKLAWTSLPIAHVISRPQIKFVAHICIPIYIWQTGIVIKSLRLIVSLNAVLNYFVLDEESLQHVYLFYLFRSL